VARARPISRSFSTSSILRRPRRHFRRGAGPLIAFRIIDYLVPLAIGCLLPTGVDLHERLSPARSKR
jgi:hypothetical protein